MKIKTKYKNYILNSYACLQLVTEKEDPIDEMKLVEFLINSKISSISHLARTTDHYIECGN